MTDVVIAAAARTAIGAFNGALGSLQASAVWPSSSVNCQNGGVWSPQVFPPSKDQS